MNKKLWTAAACVALLVAGVALITPTMGAVDPPQAPAADATLHGKKPFSESFRIDGRFGCMIYAQSSRVTPGRGALPNVPVAPCDQPYNDVEVHPVADVSVTGAVYELWWDANSAASKSLHLMYWHPVDKDASFRTGDALNRITGTVSGQSPLSLTIEATKDGYLYEFSRLDFRVEPPTANNFLSQPPAAGVITDQPFTLFVTLFYNGAQVPDCLEKGKTC